MSSAAGSQRSWPPASASLPWKMAPRMTYRTPRPAADLARQARALRLAAEGRTILAFLQPAEGRAMTSRLQALGGVNDPTPDQPGRSTAPGPRRRARRRSRSRSAGPAALAVMTIRSHAQPDTLHRPAVSGAIAVGHHAILPAQQGCHGVALTTRRSHPQQPSGGTYGRETACGRRRRRIRRCGPRSRRVAGRPL